MNLCQYSDMFGKPRQGAHSYRLPIVDIAIIDLGMTVLIVYLLTEYFEQKKYFYQYLFLTIVVGTFVHKLFCVDTTLTRLAFGKV